ncbi:MAG: hypothetical protein ACE14V_04680 [bacterium]
MKRLIIIVLVIVVIGIAFYFGYLKATKSRGTITPGVISYGTTVANPQEEWNKVLEVNRLWLDPHPRSVQYTLYLDPLDATMTIETEKVNIQDDKNWDWELTKEIDVIGNGHKELFENVVQCRDGNETYLKPEKLKARGAQPMGDTLPFRQGIEWECGIHYLALNGLPQENLQMFEKKGKEDILLLYAFPTNARANIGLGLRNSFYGQSQYRIKMMRLYIRKPDYVPILEEDFNDVTESSKVCEIDFGPEYYSLGTQKTPAVLRMRSKRPSYSSMTSWILEAQFQMQNNTWLLKEGLNIHDEKTVKRIYTELSMGTGNIISTSQQSQPAVINYPKVAIQIPKQALTDAEIAQKCKENLRELELAKQQWALENKIGATDLVTLSDITIYLRNKDITVCPLNKKPYDIGKNITTPPICPNYKMKDPVLSLHKYP